MTIKLTDLQALQLEYSMNEPLKVKRNGEIYYITRLDDETYEVRNSGVTETNVIVINPFNH